MSKRDIHFVETGWMDYLYWQKADAKMAKKINRLLIEMQRNPFIGLGKPEPLRGNFTGHWSRRVSEQHRLIYIVEDKEIRVISCRFHYDDK